MFKGNSCPRVEHKSPEELVSSLSTALACALADRYHSLPRPNPSLAWFTSVIDGGIQEHTRCVFHHVSPDNKRGAPHSAQQHTPHVLLQKQRVTQTKRELGAQE